MKSLRSILHESILDVDGPKMFDDGVMGNVYIALEKLPKAQAASLGRFCYDEKIRDKFSKDLDINIKDGEFFRCIRGVIMQHKFGIVFFSSKAPWWFVCWDEEREFVSKIEELPIYDKKIIPNIKNKMLIRRANSAFPTFEAWALKVDNIGNHVRRSIIDDYEGLDCYFFDCKPDMKLIEKILDSKQ